MLSIKDLIVEFDTLRGKLKAVRNVSFDVNNGEIVCIVGESGSGKSVTAQSILRLIPECSILNGKIEIDGENILDADKNRLSEIRGNTISMIFQEPGRSFDPLFSIGKTFHETIKAHDKNIKDDEILNRSISLLNEVGIYNAKDRLINYPHQLSGGQLQRVMIALSIASNPKYLIADEPTTALDVTIQKKIVDLIVRLRNERSLSVIFITHNLSLVRDFANRVIVMYGGIILEEGRADKILTKPFHPYTKALIKSIPIRGANYKTSKLVTIEGNVPDPLNPPTGCPFAERCSLVKNECKIKIPDFIKVDEQSKYRCIYKPDEYKDEKCLK